MKFKCGFCGVVDMPHACEFSHPTRRLQWERDRYKQALEEIIRLHEASTAADFSPGMRRAAEAALKEVSEVA